MTDWGTAIVVDPHLLDSLRSEVSRLRRARYRLLVCAYGAAGLLALTVPTMWAMAARGASLAQSGASCAQQLAQASSALDIMAQSHRRILDATAAAPSVGTKSWGRQFVVTKYLARSEAYGKFNDGFTATMKKADPRARIVAVDPALIPYGSRVWIEGIGWYNAEDCGVAIKGFRLDLMTGSHKDAMQWGRQKRFVIVVPPGSEEAAGTRASAMLPSKSSNARISEAEGSEAEGTLG